MALKIIGSGLGRTGTASLKAALEQLGFRCHHMIEVFMHMETIPLWAAAFQGRPDWPAIYKDYTATVDYPGAAFWRELAQEYPDAKVLHTLRDPDEWFESTQATIFAPRGPTENPPEPIRPMFDAMMASSRMPQNRHDRASMVAYFKKHNDEVVREIPAKRLLFYNVAEGWEPLCEFLGVPAPATPFPRVNTRDEFRSRIASGDVVKATREEVEAFANATAKES